MNLTVVHEARIDKATQVETSAQRRRMETGFLRIDIENLTQEGIRQKESRKAWHLRREPNQGRNFWNWCSSAEPIAIGSAVELTFGRLRLRPARAGAIARRTIARARRSEHRHRLGRMNLDFLETIDVLAIERVAKRAFESRQVDAFLLRYQADRLPPLAHPPRPTDPMDIPFRLLWQLQ